MRAYSLPENQRVLRLAKSDLMTQYQELSNNARFRETGTKKMRAIGIALIGIARITGFYYIHNVNRTFFKPGHCTPYEYFTQTSNFCSYSFTSLLNHLIYMIENS